MNVTATTPAAYPATAEQLAFAIDSGARRVGRNWSTHCIGHDDHRRSLDIADLPGGKLGWIDRSGRCSGDELLALFRDRGLWPAERAAASRAASSSHNTLVAAPHDALVAALQAQPIVAPPPPCCQRMPWLDLGPCEHWRQFDRELIVAHLRGNLEKLADEIIACAGQVLVRETLARHIKLSLTARSREIIPMGIPARVVDLMVAEVVNEFGN